MRRWYLFAVALLAGFLVAAPAGAQTHNAAIGYGGGWIRFADLNEGADGRALSIEPGWVASGHVERWIIGGHVGLRGSALFSQRPLEVSGRTLDVNTWLFSGGLLLRPLPVRESRAFSPFVTAGAGVVSYGLGDGPRLILTEENAVYEGNDDRRFAATAGIGFDVYPNVSWWGTPVGFRVEATDYIVLQSPFQTLEGSDIGPLHNFSVTLSLMGLIDLLP